MENNFEVIWLSNLKKENPNQFFASFLPPTFTKISRRLFDCGDFWLVKNSNFFLIGPRIRNMSRHVMISLLNWLEIFKKNLVKSNQIPLFLLFHRFCVPQPIPYLHIYYFASTSLLRFSAHPGISTSTIYCSGPLEFRVQSRFEFQGIQTEVFVCF